MATIFTPTKARDLKEGDLLDAHPERVYSAPEPSDSLPGYLTFLIVDTDNLDAPMVALVKPDDMFVVRTTVQNVDWNDPDNHHEDCDFKQSSYAKFWDENEGIFDCNIHCKEEA